MSNWNDIDLSELYTPLEEVREIVEKRYADTSLRLRLEHDFFGPPPGAYQGPRACIARAVHTWNYEFQLFAKLARLTGLKPLATEYCDDLFCTMNFGKLSRLRMTIVEGKSKDGNILRTRKIADIMANEGKPFSQIKTLWGENLLQFHHKILKVYSPDIEIVNETQWLRRYGNSARDFYPYLLAKFICHGVLFENYCRLGQENRFTLEVVLPSISKVIERYGHKPVIVNLLPTSSESDRYWDFFPECVGNLIARKLDSYELGDRWSTRNGTGE
ncbi:MAG: hypothetical protein NTW03_00135 [Verrucomicrobia bacterium]|nr:hypothetical protein [Verrucomicrobiota bacterium]